jgi:hypothetical protein
MYMLPVIKSMLLYQGDLQLDWIGAESMCLICTVSSE